MQAAENPNYVLIVDRDIALVEPLRKQLESLGISAIAIADGAAALAVLAERAPLLVILDWNTQSLAVREIFERVRVMRKIQTIRLLILSDSSDEHDIVSGLNMGADDYITKPFSIREAIARIQAILRSRSNHGSSCALTFEHLSLNTATNRVTAEGAPLSLRGSEYRLLEFLMSHPGRTFNRAQLLAQVWGGDARIDERTVDVNVQRLRKILAKPGYQFCIQTVRGFGYRFIER